MTVGRTGTCTALHGTGYLHHCALMHLKHQHNIKRSTSDSIKVAMARSAREFLESSKGSNSISVLFIFGYFMNTFSHKSMIRISPK